MLNEEKKKKKIALLSLSTAFLVEFRTYAQWVSSTPFLKINSSEKEKKKLSYIAVQIFFCGLAIENIK